MRDPQYLFEQLESALSGEIHMTSSGTENKKNRTQSEERFLTG